MCWNDKVLLRVWTPITETVGRTSGGGSPGLVDTRPPVVDLGVTQTCCSAEILRRGT